MKIFYDDYRLLAWFTCYYAT